MGDLKYRERLSSSVDKGLYRAIRKYSIETRIPLSKLLDEAIEDSAFLKRGGRRTSRARIRARLVCVSS